MTHDLLILILLVVVVLTGSALCSGVEAALLSVNPVRVVELAGRSKPVAGARRLAQLRQRLGRTLSVLVIANNGFNIFGSLMLGGYAAWLFEDEHPSSSAIMEANCTDGFKRLFICVALQFQNSPRMCFVEFYRNQNSFRRPDC